MRSICWTMSFLSLFSIAIRIEGFERYKQDVDRVPSPEFVVRYAPDYEEHC